MPQDKEKQEAAIAAASFDLMLLSVYFSANKGSVGTHLGEGLAEGGLATEADEMINRLSDEQKTLKGSPVELAARDRVACIALGEIFATALASRDSDYLRTIVPFENKSLAISNTLEAMNATNLAKCFRPTLN